MSTGKLNQIIAVVQGKKSRASKLLTEAHHGWNKDAISGIAKTYRPKAEDGDQLPPESKTIHLDVPQRVGETMEQLASFFDVVMTQENGNTQARADIEIDGAAFLTGIPVTSLLFLEKQLVDLHTFILSLPVLPPDRQWTFDPNRNCHVTAPIESVRTQKQPRVLVQYEATKEHPAQTGVYNEDVTVGTWTTTYMSSAIPASERAAMLRRVEDFQDAVKRARESANSLEVEQMTYGRKILAHVFGALITERNTE